MPVAGALIGAQGGSASSPDGEVSVVVPVGAVSGPTQFAFLPLNPGPPPPPGLHAASHIWQVSAITSSGQLLASFSSPVQVVFRYSGPSPRFIGSWDGRGWAEHPSTVDSLFQRISAPVTQLGILAAFGSSPAGPPAGAQGAGVPALLAGALIAAAGAAHLGHRRRLRPTPPGDSR
ncbi:MAG TPA: hypothetical protein VNG13_00075 [Mycobacteriales bacterium]|nr:hypothetical protein [Mycobacteriales bacterium]